MRMRTVRSPLILLSFLIALAVWTVPGTGAAFRNLKEGSPAIPFTLKTADGTDVAFKGDSGKVTVISFVDLSQSRSLEQMRDLVALQEEVGAKGVDFLFVTKYTNTVDEAKKAAADLKVKAPILFDKDQKVYGDYGLYILPSTGVVGTDGKFAFEYSSHGRDFGTVVGGRIKVLAGLMTEDDYKKSVTPVETVKKTKEAGEADKLLALGNTLLKRGMPDKAAEKFAKAVELDPKNVAAILAYGESLVAAKKYDLALAQFQKVKEINPQSKDAQLGIGSVHLEKGDIDTAIKELSEAAMLNPKPEKANFWLGAAYEKKGDLQSAVKYYRKAIEKLLQKD